MTDSEILKAYRIGRPKAEIAEILSISMKELEERLQRAFAADRKTRPWANKFLGKKKHPKKS